MSLLIVYLIKSAIYLGAFYLVYALLLSRDTSYLRNRIFIIVSLILALVLPLITFHTPKPLDIQKFGKILAEVFITADSKQIQPVTASNLSNTVKTVYTIYIIVTASFALKLLADLTNLMFLIFRHRKTGSRIIRFHGFGTSGFSAMGYIFINERLNPEDAGNIVRHEQNHLRQNHFVDIVFIELIKAVQWFNPVIYLFNRSLRAIHEYQADQDCLSSGIPVANYQSLLLNQVFKSNAFNLSNSFSNPSLVRKRMIMMTKKRTAAIANIKMLTVIPAAGLVFLAISAYKEAPAADNSLSKQSVVKAIVTDDFKPAELPPPPPPKAELKPRTKNTVAQKIQLSGSSAIREMSEDNFSSEEPFVVVEEMPMFPGGDGALLQYIANNTTYPEAAKEANIQGRVIVRFAVTATGGISNASILKGVSPELNAEALRVVNTLPEFKPGKQGGKPVPVWYMVPITFTLR